MKFAKYEFEINKDYAEKLHNKKFVFGNETGTSTIHLTFVTTCGVKRNAYSNIVQSEVLLDDLFSTIIRR